MSDQSHLVPNVFLTVTKNNFTKAATIGNDVEATLAAKAAGDAAFVPIHNTFKAANDAYQQKFAALANALGQKEGATLSLKDMIEEMKGKGRTWKRAIDAVYNEGTPEYKAILPDGITPFYTGKQTDMLTYTSAVSLALTGIGALSATKADVDAELAKFEGINTGQKGKKGTAEGASDALEAQRIDLCEHLLLAQAQITVICYRTPAAVDAFFPMELITRRPQTDYAGAVPVGVDAHFIVRRTLQADAPITLTNDGPTALFFFWDNNEHAPYAGEGTEVPPGGTVETTAGGMNANKVRCFLLVHNTEARTAGHFEVHI